MEVGVAGVDGDGVAAGEADVLKVAWPAASRPIVASVVVPSRNVTKPVGTPEPGADRLRLR